MKKWMTILAVELWISLCVSNLWAQGRPYTGPEDPAGDISAIRAGYMNGNRLLLYFENTTQIGDWPTEGTSRWPNDYTGQRMIDVASVLIGSEVYVYNDSIPIDDLNDPRLNENGNIDTLYFVESHSFGSNYPDMNYDGTVEWWLYPVPGYFNPTQDYPAMSNKPNSWPPEGWPSTGFEKKWKGEWNGRFGRGIMKAALESYFVANDAQDMEYIIQRNDPEQKLITEGPRYFPRPGRFIGDLNPNVTIQKGLPWGGLGLRVEVRGYQWSNKEAQDIVFWEYNISNISNYNLPKSGFGYFIDNSIGGDASGENEVGYRDKVLDLCYVWERLGQGEGGRMPGTMGYAYLESPGIPYDGIDNDDDGIIDERRDNPAGQWVDPGIGVDGKPIDQTKFKNFFHTEPQSHWEGDEDQDWRDGIDPDGDGRYADPDENGNWILETGAFVGDDVGLDGVGPGDLNYNGPDEGECNHKPDYKDGVGCEPNFNATDIGESDMLGLTSYLMFDWAQWQNTMNLTLDEDKNVWEVMKSDTLSEFLIAGSYGSMYMIFASAPFEFYKGRTERVSMAFMCAYENLAELNAADHRASNLFRLKEVAQTIYERDYQFAQPPIMPTLKAIAGDGKVILMWDNFSDTKTREPLLGGVNDFEGYKLYKSTDKFMSDCQIVTDGKGFKKFRAPIFQCDKVDGIKGYCPFGGEQDGHLVYLGDDTGIRHYFVDTDVQNGRTYYYALVAYDYGIQDLNIAPAENMVDIEVDESENVVRMGQNVQIVTPRQTAAGYVPPEIVVDFQNSSSRLTSGQVLPSIVDPQQVQSDHTYKLVFKTTPTEYYRATKSRRSIRDGKRVTSGIEVYDVTQDPPVRIYVEDEVSGYPENNLQYDPDRKIWMIPPDSEISTDIFQGIQCKISIPSDTFALDSIHTGWIQGSAPIHIQLGGAAPFFPYQYEIVFDPSQEYESRLTSGANMKDADDVTVPPQRRVLHLKYPFYVINKLVTDSLGNYEKLDLVLYDLNENKVFDWDTDKILVGYPVPDGNSVYWGGTIFSFDFIGAQTTSNPTAPGDVYRIALTCPLSEFDAFVFTAKPENPLDKSRVKTVMDSIKVVPNPYIATNLMETAVANRYLNQRRQLLFTHIPANCVIRIYTVSGVLVDKIDVHNEPSNGTVHWDLVTREGLEVAAGMYIFHVKSNVTGDEKIGKFAIIK